MNRTLSHLLATVALAAGLLSGEGDVASGADRRPNILLIVSDDQGWPDLGCIGTQADSNAASRPAGEGRRAADELLRDVAGLHALARQHPHRPASAAQRPLRHGPQRPGELRPSLHASRNMRRRPR